MTLLKSILVFLLSAVMGFSFWFFIGWFISSEFNLLLWPWYGKLFYLILSYQSSNGVMDEFKKYI